MPSVISGDANVSATEFGYLDGVTSALQTQLDSKLPLAGGKILQIVRATDATQRSTSSTSFVDASISVTITPQKSDSAILLIWTFFGYVSGSTAAQRSLYQIADSSNNPVSGAQQMYFGDAVTTLNIQAPAVLIGRSTPATTSAVTYKGRFAATGAAVIAYVVNDQSTGQLYAIEVSA